MISHDLLAQIKKFSQKFLIWPSPKIAKPVPKQNGHQSYKYNIYDPLFSIQNNYTQMYLIHQIYNIPCSSILPTTKIAQWFFYLNKSAFRVNYSGERSRVIMVLLFQNYFFQKILSRTLSVC